jgi:dynein heavy chain
VFGPKTGKCILFVDDLNMPSKEKYGAQPPIELLRQFIDQGGWYEHKDKEKPFRNLVDIIPVAAMGPPGGGRTFVSARLLRHFTLVSLTSFEDETLTRIFNTILHWYFAVGNFNADIVKC